MAITTAPTALERTYAGVLGKTAGVYLGRPVEGWSAERIAREYGRIDAFLPGHPVEVADDDLSGAFTFVRALEGQVPGPATAAAVAATWLDQVVAGRTTLWWGGVGSSTEHTAFASLRDGVAPPASGSAARNGRRLAEQIGARIFADARARFYVASAVEVDGELMANPGDGEGTFTGRSRIEWSTGPWFELEGGP